jgi:hypothetical protein
MCNSLYVSGTGGLVGSSSDVKQFRDLCDNIYYCVCFVITVVMVMLLKGFVIPG